MAAEGWSLTDAETFCKKYGIIIKVNEVETERIEVGKVISQSRAAGSPIARGTTLTIDVAVKPKPKPSPSEAPSTGNGGNENPTTNNQNQ